MTPRLTAVHDVRDRVRVLESCCIDGSAGQTGTVVATNVHGLYLRVQLDGGYDPMGRGGVLLFPEEVEAELN